MSFKYIRHIHFADTMRQFVWELGPVIHIYKKATDGFYEFEDSHHNYHLYTIEQVDEIIDELLIPQIRRSMIHVA